MSPFKHTDKNIICTHCPASALLQYINPHFAATNMKILADLPESSSLHPPVFLNPISCFLESDELSQTEQSLASRYNPKPYFTAPCTDREHRVRR